MQWNGLQANPQTIQLFISALSLCDFSELIEKVSQFVLPLIYVKSQIILSEHQV